MGVKRQSSSVLGEHAPIVALLQGIALSGEVGHEGRKIADEGGLSKKDLSTNQCCSFPCVLL